ncbi:hypothetical protein [Paenibacillus polymyxa]|uniref:hypothetical protein n=1 Tax=Paenibacillus polymyxa TaxID=1406 RepID=UPI0021E43E2C|nr:hypothetical protein [Paenibacillus polymyxa]
MVKFLKHVFVLTPIIVAILAVVSGFVSGLYYCSVDIMDRYGISHFWFWIVFGFLVWFSIALFIFIQPDYLNVEDEELEKAV